MNDKKEFDAAGEIFMDAFFKVHPRDSLPKWFSRYTTCGGQKGRDGIWVFAITAILASSLRPGQTWEPDQRGGYSLIATDPVSGTRSAIISATSNESDALKIFEARIDSLTRGVSVTLDTDIDGLNSEALLPMSQVKYS
ncbi:hypothetical protein [Polaromonas sp. JS666]|uniref:hypothetical protein n=1 Tax=Polaromonas sp. (strain JS666 / ATCC BAA-500) TaxID=296591 RepID=UPI001113E870|nr:hypothetical protein [Polaromonas sp. JS666]